MNSKHNFSISDVLQNQSFEYSIDVLIYELKIRIHSGDLQFINFLRNFYPVSWISLFDAPELNFYFISYEKYFDESFFSDEDPDFKETIYGNKKKCIQRDFIGEALNNQDYFFITKLEISDGYFNCLRWVLPSLLIQKNTLVIHSSCFVDDRGYAYMFLGPSGAGKTTTVSRFIKNIVLGDDMNIITLNDNGIYVQSGAIGGQIVYPKFNEKFRMSKVFWLKKESHFSLIDISTEDAQLKILGSIANLFFGHESSEFLDEVMTLTLKFAEVMKMQELHLEKKDVIWPQISL